MRLNSYPTRIVFITASSNSLSMNASMKGKTRLTSTSIAADEHVTETNASPDGGATQAGSTDGILSDQCEGELSHFLQAV